MLFCAYYYVVKTIKSVVGHSTISPHGLLIRALLFQFDKIWPLKVFPLSAQYLSAVLMEVDVLVRGG